MNVSFVTSPTASMSANTIYVLASGSYDISSTINTSNCSVLISSGNVIINKTSAINMFVASSDKWFVVDNIAFN
jgi:hypothetical protein